MSHIEMFRNSSFIDYSNASVELKGDVDTTLALALGIGLTVVLVILACAIVGVKYYHKKWRQTKAKLSPKVRFSFRDYRFN